MLGNPKSREEVLVEQIGEKQFKTLRWRLLRLHFIEAISSSPVGL